MKSIHIIRLYAACLCVILGLTTARDGLLQAVQAESSQLLVEKMSAEDFYNRGVEKFQQQDYEGAIKDFTQALRLNPENVEAYYKRGFAYYQLGDDTGAIEDYINVLRVDPDYIRRDSYIEALPRSPNLADAYYERGSVYRYEYLQDDIAIENFSQAIQLNPNLADAYYQRGLAYYDLIDFPKNLMNLQKSVEDYTQALRINPDNIDIYYSRSLAHYHLTNKQEAIEDLTQVIQLNPNDANAYYQRGFFRNELGDKQAAIQDYTQAIQIFTQVIQINPNAEAYRRRAWARYDLGDKQGAIEDSTQVIQINPNDVGAYFERGLIRSELGDAKGGEEDLEKGKSFRCDICNLVMHPRLSERLPLCDRRRRQSWLMPPRDLMSLLECSSSIPGNRGSIIVRDIDEISNLYEQAVSLFQRGDKTGSLAKFQQVATLAQARGDSYFIYQAAQNYISRLKRR